MSSDHIENDVADIIITAAYSVTKVRTESQTFFLLVLTLASEYAAVMSATSFSMFEGHSLEDQSDI